MGVCDIQSAVVGHFLLQGTDVCWERGRPGYLVIHKSHTLSQVMYVLCKGTYHVLSLHLQECEGITCGMFCCAL